MTPHVLPPVAPRPEPRVRSGRVSEIVAAARRLVAAEGEQALTMRRLADELGIRAPSLYKHLPGREAVVGELVDVTLFETGERMHAAVSAPDISEPVAALLEAYRSIGRDEPNLYRLVTASAFPRSGLTPGLEDWAGEPFYRVTGEPYRAQALWAFAHGTLILEIDGRFVPGSDLDETWRAGAHAFARSTAPSPLTWLLTRGVSAAIGGKRGYGAADESTCKPDPVPRLAPGWRPSIWACRRRQARAVYPRTRAGSPRTSAQTGVPVLLDLAPGGVYRAVPVTRNAGGLLHRRFTLTGPANRTGGLFSVALSRGSPRVAVGNHPALWSPDFPRHVPLPEQRAVTRPPGRLVRRARQPTSAAAA